MKPEKLFIMLFGFIFLTSCATTSSSNDIYFDETLTPDKTAIVVFQGWGSWGRDFTIKSYNGIPIKAGNRYILPLGKAVFEADVNSVGTSYMGGGLYVTSGAIVDEIEFELNLTESGDLRARTGKYYMLFFVHPDDEPWGINVELYNEKAEKEETIFVPFKKDGQLVYTKK
jgi:hypothetical protein